MTNKRGPKSQTLIMVPLSELINKLPASAKVKISRVWYELLNETLGSPDEPSSFPEGVFSTVDAVPETKILVESLDLSESD